MKAVILAGGLGSRLKPFTDIIPKPLLPLGEKSMLEIQIERLVNYGFDEIFIALNYKAELIMQTLGNGEKYNANISYSIEGKPLGTCGPLSLIKDNLDEQFLLMNGDILTNMDFKKGYEFASNIIDSDLTICTKIITTPFRFGRIISDGPYVRQIEEKPDLKFEVLAGIYFMKPSLLSQIPDDRYYGVDTLISDMLREGRLVSKYPIKEYWLDIGVVEDYEKARKYYGENVK